MQIKLISPLKYIYINYL